ncbi:MAG: GNAT family N-acetyltransferase [Clostridiales bacterium]|nr:GNAT family N-acetyltransferase [Clostridiales bacterium]
MIQTERFCIRKFRLEDAEDLYEVLSDAQVMKFIEPPFTMQQTREFIAAVGIGDGPSVFALQQKNGKVIGHVIFHPYRDEHCFELGWIIGSAYWHQGIASEVTEAMIRRGEQLGLRSVVMECDARQEATKHIAKKYGFDFLGVEDELMVFERQLKPTM